VICATRVGEKSEIALPGSQVAHDGRFAYPARLDAFLTILGHPSIFAKPFALVRHFLYTAYAATIDVLALTWVNRARLIET